MQPRVGALHVRYRVRDPSAAALAPSIQRALATRLSDALGQRLEAAFGDDESVIVIRELHGRVNLAGVDRLLDSRVVDRLCAASLDALRDRLSDPDPDVLMRFADEAEFVGAFILDLLEWLAWDRWYFGAFVRYRRESGAETLRAVLADCSHVARVYAWLQRRGRLEAVLALLSPGEALALGGASAERREGSGAADGLELLAGAALDIAMSISADAPRLEPAELARRYRDAHGKAPGWTDRRALSECVLVMVREFLREAPRQVAPLETREAVRACIGERFDWLDQPWLVDQLGRLAEAPEKPRSHAHDDPHPAHESGRRLIERLASRLHAGELRLAGAEDSEQRKVQLLAALATELPSGTEVDSHLLALADAVAIRFLRGEEPRIPPDTGSRAIESVATPAPESDVEPSKESTQPTRSGNPHDGVHGTRHVAPRALTPHERSWIPARAGGLFLLVRALMDLRLPALATRHAVPLPPLLSALAVHWFDIEPPFDAATELWTGAARPDFAALEAHIEPLRTLNASLADILVLRGATIEDEGAITVTKLPCSRDLEACIARTGELLLRGWALWLRAVSNSTSRFLLSQCLRREARARITETEIFLQLGPAPLDVVLRMAGYFDRIECVPWLASRAVSFEVVRGFPEGA